MLKGKFIYRFPIKYNVFSYKQYGGCATLFLFFRLSVSVLFLTLLSCVNGFAQLTLNNNVTPTQLVQTIVGAGYNVSSIKLNCPKGAIGTFTNVSSNIGISDGIILTTGSINVANGLNNNPSAGVNNGATGDFDLDQLSGANTYDACALEFDLVPACYTLKINYVFGSEEYPEYVNKQFNDVFSFYISGPGITGMKNIALVPSTTLPVAINNINAGVNSQYFVNNAGGATIQYDGFTKPMLAKTHVIPCEKYHLKLVIADVLDGIFDSGVFIKGNTIDCSPVSYNDVASNLNAVKGCSNGGFTFCRTGDTTVPYTVKYKIGGTAVNGADYTHLADSIVIPANQSCASVTLVPTGNTIGVKTVQIMYHYGYCIKYDTITLLISDPPPIDAGPNVSICSGDSAQLGISPIGGINYSWQPTAGLSNAAISNPKIGYVNNSNADVVLKYVLTVVNPQQGGCVLKDSLFVTVKPLPTAQFTTQSNYCVGSSSTFTDNSTAVPGKNISSWYWDFGNNLFDTKKNPVITYTSSGTFTVNMKVTDNGGCSDTASYTITVWPSPVINFSVSSACQGDSVLFTNSSIVPGGGTILQSIWNFGDGSPLLSVNSPSHLYPGGSNTYTAQLIVTSDKNCVNSAQQIVTLHPKPSVTFTASASCIYDQMKFQNFSTGNINFWDFGDGTTSNLSNPTHKFTTTGVHQIKLITTTNFGCKDSMFNSVTVFDKPKFDFSAFDTSGCPVFCSQFNASANGGSDSIISWDWVFSSGELAQGTSPQYCYQKDGKYSPTLIATSNHGCKDTLTKMFYINVFPKPQADFTVTPNIITVDDPDVKLYNKSSSDVNYWKWDFGDTVVGYGPGPLLHKYSDIKNYTVKLKVKNQYGCSDSTMRTITHRTESNVFIPNAFSPNSDQINPMFRPYGSGIYETASFDMSIYDRWGLRLFRTYDINKGWDGSYRDRICQEDVYVYQIFFYDRSSGNLLNAYIGRVTLIR